MVRSKSTSDPCAALTVPLKLVVIVLVRFDALAFEIVAARKAHPI